MHLTRITSARRHGFSGKPIHRSSVGRVPPWVYLKQKSSFLIAAVSLVAFVAGNMIGSHGIYAFWKSVWGRSDDSLIVYTGTVPPIAAVPDYACWARTGGGGEDHTYRQVPSECLVPLPRYDAEVQRGVSDNPVYEVAYLGSYRELGDGKGSHLGVDIAAPKDTPVRAIANGIVTSVREDPGGFGKLIVVRHPHMPDPQNPRQTTVLHSGYAHLAAHLVQEGDIVQKGQVIGLVGNTGYATGYHLHFQIDRDRLASGEEVPWHPYWAFTANEARQAGLTLAQAIDAGLHQERAVSATVHPMLYVQANYAPVVAVGHRTTSSSASSTASLTPAEQRQQIVARAVALREARLRQRLARRPQETIAASTVPQTVSPLPVREAEVRRIEVTHDRTFAGRGWETITVTLLDEGGTPVDGALLPRDVHLRTAYGDAEFRPPVLSPLDFVGGRAEVQMLPRGRRTIVVTALPYGTLSEPMRYDGR